jgi:putative flippase GtrA
MNKHIAFRDRSPITVQQCARFGGVAVATALLMAAAMQVFAVKLGIHLVAAKVVCSALVFLAWTYPAQRRLVFNRRPRLQPWMSLS